MKVFQGGVKSFVDAECLEYRSSCSGKCFPKHFFRLWAIGIYADSFSRLTFLSAANGLLVQVTCKLNKKTLCSFITVAMFGSGWHGNQERAA